MEDTMTALWTTITEVVTNFLTLIGTVCTSLLSNNMFLIMLGFIIGSVGIRYAFAFAKAIGGRGGRRRR